MMCTVLFSLAQIHFGPSSVNALHGTKSPLLVLGDIYADKVRFFNVNPTAENDQFPAFKVYLKLFQANKTKY